MSRRIFRVAIAGGGSGGHVYPALAVVEALQSAKIPLEIVRIGPNDGYETLFANRGVRLSPIVAGKVRRYASFQNFIDAPKFAIGFCQALFKLFFIMPDVVFSKGGTGALPVVLAAWLYRIPVAIHESDAVPGLTNLFSARFARKVFVGFADAAKSFDTQKTSVIGTPIRTELLGVRVERAAAKESLGFETGKFLTLILGGSQGAQRINEFILANLAAIMDETQLFHQTGAANFAEVDRLSRAALLEGSFRNRYQSAAYIEKDLNVVLAAADLVVARAGASTIAEIAAFGLPAILIPLAGSANDHQRANAYAFAKNGAAIVIEEANLLPGIFINQLKSILGDEALRAKMGAASAQFFISDAAAKIANELLTLGIG